MKEMKLGWAQNSPAWRQGQRPFAFLGYIIVKLEWTFAILWCNTFISWKKKQRFWEARALPKLTRPANGRAGIGLELSNFQATKQSLGVLGVYVHDFRSGDVVWTVREWIIFEAGSATS